MRNPSMTDLTKVSLTSKSVKDTQLTLNNNFSTIEQTVESIDIPTTTSELTNDGSGTEYEVYSKYSNFMSTSDYIGYYVLVSATYTKVTSSNKDSLNISPGTTKAYQPSPYATTKYVKENGGKIDSISVNNVTQTIVNKNVNITVPTSDSDLTNNRYVRYDTNAQGLNSTNQNNARTNIDAQKTLPTTSTAGQVLKSTSTSGTVEWGTDNNDNQTIKTSSVTFGANDAVQITAGTNVTVTGDVNAKTITIASSYTDTGAIAAATARDVYQYNNYTAFTTTSDYIGFLVGVNSGGNISYTEVTNANKDSLNITPGTTVAYKYGNAGTDLSYNSSNRTMTLNKDKVFVELNDIDNSLNTSSINPIQNKIIAALIPGQASSSNKLADKDFVNSSIATNTAYFIGTFANVPALNAYSGTVTNNDYAFVINSIITNNGNDWSSSTALNTYNKALVTNYDYAWVVNGTKFDLYRFDIIDQIWDLRVQNTAKADVTLNTVYNRYKATVSGSTVTWSYEYTLNNSSFTASQWAAINSGLSAADKTKLDGIEAGAQVNTVTSVNSKTGAVVLSASDVGAEPTILTKNTAFNKNFETSTTNIKMDGTVSVGSSDNVARADHVHPSDTSKQNVIDSSHKLSADLVDDSNTTNKFVTASDKTTWSGKQDAITSSNKLSSDLVDDTSATTNKFLTIYSGTTFDIYSNASTSGVFYCPNLTSIADGSPSGISVNKCGILTIDYQNAQTKHFTYTCAVTSLAGGSMTVGGLYDHDYYVGTGIIDSLTLQDTDVALSANQGYILNQNKQNKFTTYTFTASDSGWSAVDSDGFYTLTITSAKKPFVCYNSSGEQIMVGLKGDGTNITVVTDTKFAGSVVAF